MAARMLNLKSRETILQGYEENREFFIVRGIFWPESLLDVLRWILPEIPWPATTQMGHATQDRIMQLSDGFCVDFDAHTLKGFMIRLQHSFEDGSMKGADGVEKNEFMQLKLSDDAPKKYTGMFAIVRPVPVERDDILVILRDRLKPQVYPVHVERVAWSKLSNMPDVHILSVTVAAPRNRYHLDMQCKVVADTILNAIFKGAGGRSDPTAAGEAVMLLEYPDETTIRADRDGGGDYWYINGCYPTSPAFPHVVTNPSDLTAYVVSDTQIISNADLIMIDLPKQRAVLRRMVEAKTALIRLPFTQCALNKPASLEVFRGDTSRIAYRMSTLWYSNTRNESLRRARDDVMLYHPHASLLNGPFNVMLAPLVVIDNSADPDLSPLSFAAFCKYHAACGIRQVDIEFANPRRIADVALYLHEKKRPLNDTELSKIDMDRRMVCFTLTDEFEEDDD